MSDDEDEELAAAAAAFGARVRLDDGAEAQDLYQASLARIGGAENSGAASSSSAGVGICGEPWKATSLKPRSSAIINTTGGGAGGAAAAATAAGRARASIRPALRLCVDVPKIALGS